MLKHSLYCFFLVIIFGACKKLTTKKPETNTFVQYIDKVTISDKLMDSTIVGGLSSIDYLGNDQFVVISDDRSQFSPARIYQMKIEFSHKRILNYAFNRTVFLKNRNGDFFRKNEVDPEAIRYRASDSSYFYTSEGGRTDDWLNPFIWKINEQGEFSEAVNVPDIFQFYDEKGIRENGAFESLTFESDTIIWYANELPLIEDGLVPAFEMGKYPIRLVRQDIKNNKVLNQYVYNISPLLDQPIPKEGFFINSVPDVLFVKENTLWVIERSYVKGMGNFVKLFEIETDLATDVKNVTALLEIEYETVSKKLLFDFSNLDQKIDNIEGMTLGPDFEDGSKSLILISDDNFDKEQETQLWLFSVSKK